MSSLPYSSAPLFAVRCVLLQFRVARHPPYALAYLISWFSSFFQCAFYKIFLLLMKTVISLTVSQCYLPQLAFKTSSLLIYCVFSFKFVYDDFQRSISALRTIPENLTELLLTSLHLLRFLLRKEVIHPHVPVGIPCYDLTPVIGPAFDGSLLFRLRHRLRALPTPMV